MTLPSSAPTPAAPAAPVRTESRIRTYSIAGVIRVVGYGLLVMFLLDLPPIVITYIQKPFDPQMDATLVGQILERIAVPLIAFALIFGFEAHDLPRWERMLRKLMSYVMILSSIGCLGLAGLAVGSGVRQYNHAIILVDFRANQRAATLTELGKQLPGLSGEALRATYLSVTKANPAKPLPSVPEMKQAIANGIPGAIDGLYATAKNDKSIGKRNEVVSVGKYALDGLIAAVMFFVLWEASSPARAYRVFRPKGAPSLGVEGAVIGGIANVGRKIESIRILPNMEDYAWYRRLRRKWRHRNDHKHR